MNSSVFRSLLDDSDESSQVDSLDKIDPVLHRYATFICSVIMCACCLVGVFGNTISLIIFTRRSMRSPINVFLAGLSLVDLFVVIFAVPVFVTPGIGSFYFHSGSVDISQDAEKAAAYGRFLEKLYLTIVFGAYQLNMIAQSCSVWTCLAICSERYLAVCKPFMAQRYSTVNRARIVQISIFVAAIAYNFIRFFEYEPGSKSGTYQRRLRDDTLYIYIYYTGLYLLSHFLIPFFFITITNVLILRTMRRAHKLRRLMTSHKTVHPPQQHAALLSHRSVSAAAIGNGGPNFKGTPTGLRHQNSDRRSSAVQQRQTSRVIVVVTIMFALCNTLSFVMSIWEAFDLDLFYGNAAVVAFLLLDLSNVLVVFNSASTFVFYLRYCTKYRRLFLYYCANVASRSRFCNVASSRGNFEISNGYSGILSRPSENAGHLSRHSVISDSLNKRKKLHSRAVSCDEPLFSRPVPCS